MKKPKTPNYASWITLQPSVQKANMTKIGEMIVHEGVTLKRPYILKRLISAYLSHLRKRLYKEHKLTSKKP